ncbi:MAG: integrase [Alphaproteobacteria bacterium]|jgi:integrase
MAVEAKARRGKPLTSAFVRNVKDPGKYHDGHGLILRVKPNGSKQWVQRIVIRGKRCELGLGSTALVSLADARESALNNRRAARSGGDPLQAKRESEAVLTFEEAALRVHAIHVPTWRNPKHAAQFLTTLETYVFPHFGNLRISEVSSANVLAALTPIWTSKPETARRVRQRIGTVMKWAVAQGWRTDNPAASIAQGLPKQETVKSHRKALPYSEVAGCIETIRSSRAGISTKLAFEFLVLTASRSGEARKATWDEFNFDRAEWLLPAERMKAKREHRVPLSARALEILDEAQTLADGSGLVFPGTLTGKALSDMTLSKLVKELGFDADVHGFRTSFRTWAQEQTNFPREVAEAAIAHVNKNKSEAAYARSDLFEKRRMLMDTWASYLASEAFRVMRFA